MNRLRINRRAAAALDRLLQAYLGTEEADPGLEDLRGLAAAVAGLEQDHSRYHAVLGEDADCQCAARQCVQRHLRAL